MEVVLTIRTTYLRSTLPSESINALRATMFQRASVPMPQKLTRIVTACGLLLLIVLLRKHGSTLLLAIADLPLYFHVLLLVNLGIWCWASNVHVLLLSGIDVYSVLQDDSRYSSEDDGAMRREGVTSPTVRGGWSYHNVYGLACGFTVATLASLYIFLNAMETYGEEGAEIVPGLTYAGFLLLTVWPWNFFFRSERMKFLR